MTAPIQEESGSLARYFSDTRGFSLLTREEELALAERIQKGERGALDRLVESNLRFVTVVALPYRTRGLPLEDLVSEGNLGLIEAAKRYEPNRNARFITYAAWWIRKAILEALSNKSRLVRLPEYQISRHRDNVRAKVSERAPGRMTEKGVSARRGSDEQPTWTTSTFFPLPRELSLEDRSWEEAGPLGESLPAHLEGADEKLLKDEMGRLVRMAVSRLASEERAILIHRFGLDGRPSLTYREVGKLMGLSHERIRRIETEVKRRLRDALQTRSGSRDINRIV